MEERWGWVEERTEGMQHLTIADVREAAPTEVKERVGVAAAIKDELEHLFRLQQGLQTSFIKGARTQRGNVDEHHLPVVSRELG